MRRLLHLRVANSAKIVYTIKKHLCDMYGGYQIEDP